MVLLVVMGWPGIEAFGVYFESLIIVDGPQDVKKDDSLMYVLKRNE